MHSTACTADPGQGSSSDRGGKPMKGGGWICREEIAARKAHKVCICCTKEGHIEKDCRAMSLWQSLCQCGPPLRSRCTPCVPSWQQSPPCRSNLHPSWVCHLCQKRSAICPAFAQYCMYSTQTAVHTQLLYGTMPCTALAGQSYMNGTKCTALHAQHSVMHSTTCTVSRHAQHYMHSTTCTALHAQHYMHITWTALTQHCMHSSALVLVRDVLCSYFTRGCAPFGLSPKIRVCMCMRACMRLFFVGPAVCKTEPFTNRQMARQTDRSKTGGTLLFPTPTITTATVSDATTTPLRSDLSVRLSVRQSAQSAICWSAHLSVSDWLSEMRVYMCHAAGARGLASGWRGMERAEPLMLSAPRSGLYNFWTKTLVFLSERDDTCFLF